MFRLLLTSLLSGLWQTLAQCQNLHANINISWCYNTSSGRTCFTTYLNRNGRLVRQPFNEASHWCKLHDPGSSFIVIDSLEKKKIVDVFIGRHVLANETIVIDARKLSARNSLEWSWVNGQPNDLTQNATEIHDGACVESKPGQQLTFCFDGVWYLLYFICEYSESISRHSYRHTDKFYVASEGLATWHDARNKCLRLGGDLASITDLNMIANWSSLIENERYWIGLHRNKWIWNSTGAAITYTDWEGGYPDESADKHCICIPPLCRNWNYKTICETDRKWWTCNCNHTYAIVCQRGSFINTFANSSMTQKPSDHVAVDLTTLSSSTALFDSFTITELFLVLFLFVTVVLIAFVVLFVIRRCKKLNARRNEESPLSRIGQHEATSSEYEAMDRDKRRTDDTIPVYTDLELTQQTTPSSGTINANVHPTGEAVYMDIA